jgi:hypothetical protein
MKPPSIISSNLDICHGKKTPNKRFSRSKKYAHPPRATPKRLSEKPTLESFVSQPLTELVVSPPLRALWLFPFCCPQRKFDCVTEVEPSRQVGQTRIDTWHAHGPQQPTECNTTDTPSFASICFWSNCGTSLGCGEFNLNCRLDFSCCFKSL